MKRSRKKVLVLSNPLADPDIMNVVVSPLKEIHVKDYYDEIRNSKGELIWSK